MSTTKEETVVVEVDVSKPEPAVAAADAKQEVAPTSVVGLFRFATPYDVFLVCMACLMAMCHGVIMPLFSLFFGDIINGLNSGTGILDIVGPLCGKVAGLAVAAGVSAFLQCSLANVAAVRQVRALRSAYMGALLRQDMAWTDKNPPGEVAARISEDTVAIEDGIGMKFSMIFQSVSTFLAGIILAFTLSWKMSLVLLGFLPFLGGVMGMISMLVLGADQKGNDAYAEAGEVATEALANIRTVAAYSGEATLAKRYDSALGKAEASGVRKATLTGLTFGTFLMTLFVVYGVCLLWGAQLVLWSRGDNPLCLIPTTPGCFTGGTVMQVLFALIMGAGALGQMAPSATALTAARGAGGRIFQALDRVPPIDSAPPAPPPAASTAAAAAAAVTPPPALTTLPPVTGQRGTIEFRDVTFFYPTRPTVPVLSNFSLTIPAGQALALVGPSGCGKSTLIALVQRWYDVSSGAVLVDGVDVRQWDVQALRGYQALVSQESLLLAGSVAYNLGLGLAGVAAAGSSSSSSAAPTPAQLEAAARAANAHDFIAALPAGYDTLLSNASLSGGQRQRVCIARALLRGVTPLLLLDEATSALDTRSERVVQEALDRLLSAGGGRRTSLTIAHRLSTIDGADRVVVMSGGRIVEEGAPRELMAKEGGVFRAMREAQDTGGSGAGKEEEGEGEAEAEAAAATATAAAASAAVAAEASAAAASAGTTTTTTLSPTAPGGKKAAEAEELPLLAEEGEPAYPPVPWSRVASYNSPEALYAVLGVLSCAVTGATMPAFSILLSRFISLYYDPNPDSLWASALFYMGMFILIGGANFVFCCSQQWAFGVLGERLVRRARSAAFASLLRFETAWHDAHPPGAVTSLLGASAYLLRSATGAQLALAIQNIIGLLAGLIIAFTASWQITLVVLCLAPFIALGGMLALRYATRSMEESTKAFEASGAVATEALSAPRTVAAYGLQAASQAAYSAALDVPTAANLASAAMSGIGMGTMTFMMLITYAVIFGVGAVFINMNILTFQNLLTAMFGVMFAAMGMGNSGGMQADAAKVAASTSTLFGLIDRKPRIPLLPPAAAAATTTPTTSSGGAALSIRNVTLQYKGRAGAPPALNGLSLDIPAGSFVALVGPSGCGKSSVVSLLLRLYEPSSGSVLLNGVDIRAMPLQALRAQMAWVQQEPSLFNSSIAYNIGFPHAPPPELHPAEAAGAAAADPQLQQRIQAAAQASGAHDFVAALPAGYDTLCGTRGSQLSGGQKQRLCISRALMQSAPLLLLDEATSALDPVSEAQVQASLDQLMAAQRAGGQRSATVLVIAHRLSTVQAADLVLVMDAGRVVESGSYAELAHKEGGAFKAMLALQGLA